MKLTKKYREALSKYDENELFDMDKGIDIVKSIAAAKFENSRGFYSFKSKKESYCERYSCFAKLFWKREDNSSNM